MVIRFTTIPTTIYLSKKRTMAYKNAQNEIPNTRINKKAGKKGRKRKIRQLLKDLKQDAVNGRYKGYN